MACPNIKHLLSDLFIREKSLIIGVGADIHEVERTAEAINRRGAKYLSRLFTAAEIQDGANRRDAAGFFARRFAAKEACAKALGTGITGRIGWQDIEISADNLGAPKIALSGGALRRFRRLAPKGSEISAHLSLATAGGMSVAMVVLEATAPDKAQHVQVQGAESFVVTESLQSSKRMNARSSARWIVDLRY